MCMTALACVLLLRRGETIYHSRLATAIEGSEHNPETKEHDSTQGAPTLWNTRGRVECSPQGHSPPAGKEGNHEIQLPRKHKTQTKPRH